LGNDTYFINEGDGNDTIEDKDGDNTVILCDKVLNIFYKTEDGNTYISPDGSQTLKKSTGILEGPNGIVVTLNQNFEEGDFGITMVTVPKDIPQLPAFEVTNMIVGDLTPVDFKNLRRTA
jgi:hypothetical protein